MQNPNELHGKKVQHVRTGIIRTIFCLEDNDTPSGEALKKGYNCITCILYDTYFTNKIFYKIIG